MSSPTMDKVVMKLACVSREPPQSFTFVGAWLNLSLSIFPFGSPGFLRVVLQNKFPSTHAGSTPKDEVAGQEHHEHEELANQFADPGRRLGCLRVNGGDDSDESDDDDDDDDDEKMGLQNGHAFSMMTMMMMMMMMMMRKWGSKTGTLFL